MSWDAAGSVTGPATRPSQLLASAFCLTFSANCVFFTSVMCVCFFQILLESPLSFSLYFLKVPIVIYSNYKENGYAFFWGVTHHILVNTFRRFGTTYRFHIKGSRVLDFFPLEDWPDRLSRNVGTDLPLYAA